MKLVSKNMALQLGGILAAGCLGVVIGCSANPPEQPAAAAGPASPAAAEPAAQASSTAPGGKHLPVAHPDAQIQCGGSQQVWGGKVTKVLGGPGNKEQMCDACKSGLANQGGGVNTAGITCAGCAGPNGCKRSVTNGVMGFGCEEDISGIDTGWEVVNCWGNQTATVNCTDTGRCDGACCSATNPKNVCNTTNQCVAAGCKCNGMGENHDVNGCVADGNSCSQQGGILGGCGAGSGCP